MTIEEYAQNIKTTVFGMTGALGSRMEKIMDELLSTVVQTQNQAKTQGEQLKTQGEEILRLQDLLKQNKISYEKLPNGKVKTGGTVKPPTTK